MWGSLKWLFLIKESGGWCRFDLQRLKELTLRITEGTQSAAEIIIDFLCISMPSLPARQAGQCISV